METERRAVLLKQTRRIPLGRSSTGRKRVRYDSRRLLRLGSRSISRDALLILDRRVLFLLVFLVETAAELKARQISEALEEQLRESAIRTYIAAKYSFTLFFTSLD